MELSLQNFISLEDKNKIIIIGDMHELGIETDVEHKNIVNLLKANDNIKCFFAGKYFYKNNVNKENLYFFEDFDNLLENIKTLKLKNNLFFIKGSRVMKLERILEFI